MSFKAKDLAYEAKEPAFLQRLRAQQAGFDPDRHERQLARPRRNKAASADDDDAPTYVDEDTNETLSKEEYEALVIGGESATGNGAKSSTEAGDLDLEKNQEDAGTTATATATDSASTQAEKATEELRQKQSVAEVGKSSKKRKVIKAVGGLDEEEDDAQKSGETRKVFKKSKAKSKAVVLSFDGD